MSKQKKVEDASWKESDKKAVNKEKRASTNEDKFLEDKKKKEELKQLAKQEEEELGKGAKGVKALKPVPITKYQAEQKKLQLIQETNRKAEEDKENTKLKDYMPPSDSEDEEEVKEKNWKVMWEEQETEMIEATGIDGAFGTMQENAKGEDKHPEKRMKAAWMAYCDERMPSLKTENPNLKRSQYLQMVSKEVVFFCLYKKLVEKKPVESDEQIIFFWGGCFGFLFLGGFLNLFF